MREILHRFFILQEGAHYKQEQCASHLPVQSTTALDSLNSSIIKTYWMHLIILWNGVQTI
jgi:hypothetical protein